MNLDPFSWSPIERGDDQLPPAAAIHPFRMPELQLAVRQSLELIPLFMNGAMVATT
jgi:hypothetical protein